MTGQLRFDTGGLVSVRQINRGDLPHRAMRVGVIQSCYLPWRGYFDFIDCVDLFVIYDDVQYSSGSWRNRNQIKTREGLRWLTVPIRFRFGDSIDSVTIGQTTGNPWQENHRRALQEALGRAPYFRHAMDIWESAVAHNDEKLTLLNRRLIEAVCSYLKIQTPIVLSGSYGLTGFKTARLIDLLTKVGATAYVSGPTAKGYLEERCFAEAEIRLEYKTYDYPPYPQQWGEFVGTVTVLDLIANCGPCSRDFLTSRTPDEVAVAP